MSTRVTNGHARAHSTHAQRPSPTAFRGVPPGVTTHILSSSDKTNTIQERAPGNTGVRRKALTGHAAIAEATKSTGVVMASQLKDIADASLVVERNKVDVQLKLFEAQMAYQRERDL